MRLCWTRAARLVVVGVALTVASPPSRAANPKQVEEAIAKARTYLLNSQREGQWENVPRRMPDPVPNARGEILITDIINASQWGGETALVTYALIAAGESPQEPRMAQALKWLQVNDLTGTYAVAMRAQIWNLLPPAKRKEFTATIKKDLEILILNLRGHKLLGKAVAPAAGGRRPGPG